MSTEAGFDLSELEDMNREIIDLVEIPKGRKVPDEQAGKFLPEEAACRVPEGN